MTRRPFARPLLALALLPLAIAACQDQVATSATVPITTAAQGGPVADLPGLPGAAGVPMARPPQAGTAATVPVVLVKPGPAPRAPGAPAAGGSGGSGSGGTSGGSGGAATGGGGAATPGTGTGAGGTGGGGADGDGSGGVAGTEVPPVDAPVPGQAASAEPLPDLPPPAEGPLPPLAVVAVTASGANPGFEAARAVDGDAGTQWGVGADAVAPTLALSFNRPAYVAGVAIKTGPTPAGASYVIETSMDGQAWTTALTTRNTGWGSEDKALPGAPEARHVRVRYLAGTSGKGAFAVFELAVQAAAVGAPTPGGTAAPAAGAAIVVDVGRVLHRATSHVLGTNRNHVTSDFPNGAAKLEALKALRPTWAEGKYLYRIGHGPTDGRHDYAYMTGFHFEQTWDKVAPYPYDDLRNGLREAETLGADQIHVVNYGTGTPEEAGRYVSYLNKAGDANRAAHPHAQQNVRLFELGNEIPWSMVRGHAEHAATDQAYATRAKTFAEAMRRNSDVPIQVGAVASINSNWEGNGWSGGAKTVKTILTTMGDQVDFLIYHGYPSWPLHKAGDLWTLMAQNEWSRQKLEREIKPAIKQYAGGRDVWIANTEFFTHLYNDVTRARGMFGALYSADTVILAMNQDIRTAVQFCFEHKELADASFFFGNDPTKTTAIFKFQQLLAQHWGDEIVATEGRELPVQRVQGASTALDVPKLAFTAAVKGDKAWVMVLNRAPDADVTARVDLGFTPSAARAWELSGAGGWDAANGEVKAIADPALGGYAFPRASVTLFELTR